MRQRRGVRSIKFVFEQDTFSESVALTSSLVTALAEQQLQRLHYIFSGEMHWNDALLPVGPCGLSELVLEDCELTDVPAALTTLAGSLTSLSLSIDTDYAEEVELGELIGLAQALRSLTNLQHLHLRNALLGPGQLHTWTVVLPCLSCRPCCAWRKLRIQA